MGVKIGGLLAMDIFIARLVYVLERHIQRQALKLILNKAVVD